MSEPVISIRNLYKIFGDDPESALEKVRAGMGKPELLEETGHVLGLNNINIDMPAGKTTVIMGLSGSGKSTLIRHLNRLIEPTAGEVIVKGEDVLQYDEAALRDLRRNTMSMVFQHFALLPHKSVAENTGLSLAVRGRDRRAVLEAATWLGRVGLDGYGDYYPNQLSGGMQQRVGIARALASDSPIMLMDEAFSALDPIIRTEMQDLLLELQQELQKTVIFISHDLDEALKLADHLVILKDGEVVQQGEPQRILLHPSDPYIENFISDINRARVLRVRSVMDKVPDDGDPRWFDWLRGKDGEPEYAGAVDINDNLEMVIGLSGGDTSLNYQVMKEGTQVGVLHMKTLVRALVPSHAENGDG